MSRDPDIAALADDAFADYVPGPPPIVPIKDAPGPDRRHRIALQTDDLQSLTAQAWIALTKWNDPEPRVFRRGSLLVRIEHTDRGDPLLVPLDVYRIRHLLARCAIWTVTRTNRETKEKFEALVKPPLDVCRDLLATPDPPVPLLSRVTDCPVFAGDGSIRLTAGYHEPAQTYAEFTGTLPPIPAVPTLQHVQDALALILDDVCGDFPFVSDADRCHALALFLLPFARDFISGPTPLHLVEAPTLGTGKSLLAEVLLHASCGRTLATMAPAEEDDEWRKRITVMLREGRPAVLLDNLSGVVDSPSLAAAITLPEWSDRLLGQSDSISFPIRLVWVASANNPVVSAEIARRSVRIRIDAGEARPWERQSFRYPHLREHVHAIRPALISAGLTLIRHWIAQDRPLSTIRPLGSFESWTAVLGGLVESCGLSGFLTNVEEFYSLADRETASWEEFVGAWWERYESLSVGVADLYPLAVATDGFDLGRGQERSQRTALGMALGKWRDRIVSGYRIYRAKTGRVTTWALQKVE